jgi:hypothetical protein
MSHGIARFLEQIFKEFGLPDWAAWFLLVPLVLLGAVAALLLRRKHIRVLRRKIAPYDGVLRHGLFFWAPTAFFSVDGIPGELPWVSWFGRTHLRFRRLMAAGRILIDSRGVSGSERRNFRGEDVTTGDKIFDVRFQAVAAPVSFAEAFFDAETRRRIVALLQLSRVAVNQGRVAHYFVSSRSTEGRLRIEIDGKEMRLRLQGEFGTREVEALLDHAAHLCRHVKHLSAPESGNARQPGRVSSE